MILQARFRKVMVLIGDGDVYVAYAAATDDGDNGDDNGLVDARPRAGHLGKILLSGCSDQRRP